MSSIEHFYESYSERQLFDLKRSGDAITLGYVDNALDYFKKTGIIERE